MFKHVQYRRYQATYNVQEEPYIKSTNLILNTEYASTHYCKHFLQVKYIVIVKQDKWLVSVTNKNFTALHVFIMDHSMEHCMKYYGYLNVDNSLHPTWKV